MIVYQIGDGQTISSVLRDIAERRRRRGCDCVFPPSASQLSKITQAEFALQKPLPRQLERKML